MTIEKITNSEEITSHTLEGVKSWMDPRIKPEWIEQILKCRNSSGFVPTDDDVLRHLHGDVLTLGFKNDIVVGFNCIEFKSPDEVWGGLIKDRELSKDTGVYFAGALIDGSIQKTGFYRQMNENRILKGIERGLSTIFTETANPNVEAGIKNTLNYMKEQGQIADYSMEDRIYLKGLYGRRMYTENPKNAKISFDELNYDEGDAYALVFHLDKKD